MSAAVQPKEMMSLDQLKQLFQQPDRIISELRSLLKTMADSAEETRAWAADCLQEIERIEPAKAAEIVSLCEHDSEFVVYWTITMLGKAGDTSAYQVQLTQALSKHPSTTVRQAAASVLRLAKEANSETKEALRQATSSSDPRLKRLAEQALVEIG